MNEAYSQFTNDMQWFSANISKITKPTVLQHCKGCFVSKINGDNVLV